MNAEWTRHYLGNFDSERDSRIDQFAREYNECCERYDLTVCSGRRGGVAIPLNGREQGLISKNALSVRDSIMERALEFGITWKEIKDAMRRY